MLVPVADAGPELERLIARANELELLVVLSGAPAGSFRDRPNVVREEDLAIARGWEPEFADAASCAKLPADPAAVTREVEQKLKRFDAEQADWVVSTYEPGGLVDELFGQDGTTLENGWTLRLPRDRAGGRRAIDPGAPAGRRNAGSTW